MRQGLFFTLILCVLWAFSGPAVSAAEPPRPASAVWKRYLSASEQQALAEFMAGLHAEQSDKPVEPMGPPAMDEATLAAMRQGYEQFAASFAPPLAGVTSEPFSENGVRGRWFIPAKADQRKVLLYFHGGGYVLGSPTTGAIIAGFLAREAGILCFSLDYPLAPEFPFPAAPNQALVAYKMLLAKGFQPDNIVLAGDSAGGGLALVLLLDIRDQSLPMPAGAYLLSPWTDLSHSFASHEDKRLADSILTREVLELMASTYVGAGDRRQPRISPAFAKLQDLPPLLIHVGSREILLDDSLVIARNAALADVPVTVVVLPGYGHVFQMTHNQLAGARRSLQDGAGFLREALEKKLFRAHESTYYE